MQSTSSQPLAQGIGPAGAVGGGRTIHVRPGDQTVLGGAGDDTIFGSAGAQMLIGGDGNDVIGVGPGAQTVLGGAGDDYAWGNSGPQLLVGEDGNDQLYSVQGNQTLLGGAGNDVLGGHAAAPGNHTLLLGEDGDDDFLAQGRDDVAFGGPGNDWFEVIRAWEERFSSTPFAHHLDGGAGNDIFHAGDSNATLTGGAGRDRFGFSSEASAPTVITDFQPGQDIVDLYLIDRPPDMGRPQPVPAVSTAPGPDGGAVLHLSYGATITLLGVPASRVAAHMGEYVERFV